MRRGVLRTLESGSDWTAHLLLEPPLLSVGLKVNDPLLILSFSQSMYDVEIGKDLDYDVLSSFHSLLTIDFNVKCFKITVRQTRI